MARHFYRIKDKTTRINNDLGDFQQAIEGGVSKIFPNAQNIKVDKEDFQFDIDPFPSNADLREMGKEIARRNDNLHQLASDNNQIFVRFSEDQEQRNS